MSNGLQYLFIQFGSILWYLQVPCICTQAMNCIKRILTLFDLFSVLCY